MNKFERLLSKFNPNERLTDEEKKLEERSVTAIKHSAKLVEDFFVELQLDYPVKFIIDRGNKVAEANTTDDDLATIKISPVEFIKRFKKHFEINKGIEALITFFMAHEAGHVLSDSVFWDFEIKEEELEDFSDFFAGIFLGRIKKKLETGDLEAIDKLLSLSGADVAIYNSALFGNQIIRTDRKRSTGNHNTSENRQKFFNEGFRFGSEKPNPTISEIFSKFKTLVEKYS